MKDLKKQTKNRFNLKYDHTDIHLNLPVRNQVRFSRLWLSCVCLLQSHRGAPGTGSAALTLASSICLVYVPTTSCISLVFLRLGIAPPAHGCIMIYLSGYAHE